MKISLNWIKDYVDLPDSISAVQMARDLTMSTVEVEEVVDLGAFLDSIAAGRILQVAPHPNADRLRVCKVDLGEAGIQEIVCGGSNVAPEMLVAVALPGAFVRWHGEGDPVKIAVSKLRGVKSFGMICSSSEIGLSDLFPDAVAGEILDITPFQCCPGTPLASVLGLQDTLFEIDNKSLTNRPDLWSHYGIAREFAALYKQALKPLPEEPRPQSSDQLNIRIDAPQRCPRYAALRMENVAPLPSPFWLKSRIWRVGMRPINILVDITNYVMLSVGQPTHGFDATHVKGGIIVREAFPGEKLSLLNGKEVSLAQQDLVIADEEGAIALAGIMGGEKDSILENTTEMILEIANFDAIHTRKTAQRFDLRTEASMRFEKGMDPQRVDQAIALSLHLFRQECPGIRITSFLDCYPAPLECSAVELPLSLLERQMGHRLPDTLIHELLQALGFAIRQDDDVLHVIAPSWRSTGDITLPDDIIEEIARLYGYENFETLSPTLTFHHAINQREYDLERRIREYLAQRCDVQEIFTYPWVKDTFLSAAHVDTSAALQLATPPAPDESFLRTTLVPNLLEAVYKNLRYFDAFRIFELTQVFRSTPMQSPNTEQEKLPSQPRCLAAALTGNDPVLLFREAKGILESMGRFTQMDSFSFSQENSAPWADKTLWLNVLQNGESVGILALVSAETARAAGIKRASVVLFELNIEPMRPFPSRQNHYTPLPEYPEVEIDLSVLFDESTHWADIETTVQKASKLIREIHFVDEYRGQQVPEGKKSIMLRLTLGQDSGTLTSDQVEKVITQATQKLQQALGGEIRGA